MSKIFQAIPAAMADIEAISKDRVNQKQNFKFRGIDDIYNALHPILAKHKIFTATRVVNMQRSERASSSGGTLLFTVLTIEFDFFAEDGSKITQVIVGEAMDSGDKSCNKAMAIAHKYAFLHVFAIPTEDEKDPDAQAYSVKSEPKPSAIKSMGAKSLYGTVGKYKDKNLYDVQIHELASYYNYVAESIDTGKLAGEAANTAAKEVLGVLSSLNMSDGLYKMKEQS